MKKQNNQPRQSPLSVAGLTIILVLYGLLSGCSDFTKGVKEGYDNSKNTTSSSSSNESIATKSPSDEATPTTSPTAKATPKPSNLAEDIVGKWEMTNSNSKTVAFDFSADKKLETIVDGKSIANGTYRIVDEKTVETKTTDGKVTETIPMKIEGNKMTMNYNGTDLHLTKK